MDWRGWGIDALIGEQTRRHRDLDLMHRDTQEPAVVAALADIGFVETLDLRPVRFVVTDPLTCLSAEQQVYFHQSYQPAAHDRHDMAQLRRAFRIATHF